MAQDIFDSIDPDISGTDLATVLNDFKNAMVSGLSGTERPDEIQPGGGWVDTSNDPDTWSYKVWTGVNDVEVFVIDLVSGGSSVSLAVDSFIVRKVSADTVGAIMNLVKRRIATNGQVLSGDVVGEIRMVGRDDTGSDPIVAKIVFTANENQTSSANGGTLSFHAIPQGQSALVEHMRFINGLVETVVPLKTNSAILTGQNVASSATIAQLAADKVLVEITGSTLTSIESLNSGQASKVVTIHNRASANVLLRHENAGSTAADRIYLPEGKDIIMVPQDSTTLYYCTADSRWKIQYAAARFNGFTKTTIYADLGTWVAPYSVSKARITAQSKTSIFSEFTDPASRVVDIGRAVWGWGKNGNGQLGTGDVTNRSSPTAVVGNRKFIQFGGAPDGFNISSLGLAEGGAAYGWGVNSAGQLGVGDTTPRSSPVAVLGGLTFKTIRSGARYSLGITSDGALYAWGDNSSGQLGVGDVTPRSSPVAVTGGLNFRDIISPDSSSTYATTYDGSLYAWGYNASGELGVGDIVSRSSPVAVLGGLKFRMIKVCNPSTYGITESGDLYAWGLNNNGQLGVGDVASRSTPTLVLGGLKWKDVIGNFDGLFSQSAIGITEDGVAYAWGGNDKGQLGVGNIVPRSSPVAVLGGLSFAKILSWRGSSYGLMGDGTLYAWGQNGNGELGHGDNTDRSSPVLVIGGLSFQDIHALTSDFGASTFGLGWDGKLYAWGNNDNGELGVGDIAHRSSPVLVLGNLSLKTQDDYTTVLDIPIVGGNTYEAKLGAGPCFFGNTPIGNNIQKLEITYVQ